jgi:hypothetical protein
LTIDTLVIILRIPLLIFPRKNWGNTHSYTHTHTHIRTHTRARAHAEKQRERDADTYRKKSLKFRQFVIIYNHKCKRKNVELQLSLQFWATCNVIQVQAQERAFTAVKRVVSSLACLHTKHSW